MIAQVSIEITGADRQAKVTVCHIKDGKVVAYYPLQRMTSVTLNVTEDYHLSIVPWIDPEEFPKLIPPPEKEVEFESSGEEIEEAK